MEPRRTRPSRSVHLDPMSTGDTDSGDEIPVLRGRGATPERPRSEAAPKAASAAQTATMARTEQIRQARLKGYEGDPCPTCHSFTLVRNGTCLKCETCGSTTGCS